ncbi:antifreeze protein Maxi-like [Panicum miliaceum]|uniref:Antifreeze protein Maxi-like n=1 Tax=Panicum miliaceum TaxID=4540 RepID=A0A3L6R6M5_PANMI|nr:antifreeze protein Maxi-like [Panicum miliaceum]
MASGSSSPAAHAAAVLVLLLFSSAGAGEAAAAPALDEVCGRLGGYYVTPALCASALCADPSAPCRAARDAPAVAALAARLAADNATAARDSIEAVLSSSPSPPSAGPASAAAAGNSSAAAASAAARSCLQLYAGAVPALRWAARAVAAGRYRGAREVLQAAQYVAAGCEGMAGDAAALPRENGGFGDMAFVAHAVVASMAAD